MKNAVFGEVKFNLGWETVHTIKLFGKENAIVVCAKSYFEKDCITTEQEVAFSYFKNKQIEQLKEVETMLYEFNSRASVRYIPRMLFFQRDGGYALLFDDNESIENGIAVCLAPKKVIMFQDEYL